MTTVDAEYKDNEYREPDDHFPGVEKPDRGYQSDQSDHEEGRHNNDANRGRAANFYINGDVFFTAKRVVYNPKHFKDMTHYLDYLTERMAPRFGAVRKIHTPKYGHRIGDLKDLKENASYVVAGSERFKSYPYDQIIAADKRKSQPMKYDADPVSHNRLYLSSGKIHKIDTHAVLIKVWPNGDDLRGPRRVLLTPRVRPFTLENVMAQVNEMLKEDCLGTVEKLYMLNGIKVSDIDQIVSNGQYVACRKTERFKRAKYTEHGVKNMATSPRLERKYLAPLAPRSNNSTNQSTPEHSNESTQNSVHSYPYRQRMLAKEDNVFPAKPVKYARTHDNRPNNHADYDQDQGGVFKAKQSNRTTKDAKEIPDSRHTRTDYPIDHQKAREVEEEEIPSTTKENADDDDDNDDDDDDKDEDGEDKAGHWAGPDEERLPIKEIKKEPQQKNKADGKANKKQTPSNEPKQDDHKERVESATKIQAGYRGYKTRKDLAIKNKKDITKKPAHDDDDEDLAAARIQAGFRGYQTRKEISKKKQADKVEPEKEKQLGKKKQESDRKTSTPVPSHEEVENATTRIQAGFRGYQTRKEIKKAQEEQAALRIQSGYRGYQTRKHLAQIKDAKPRQETPKPADPEEDRWEQEEWAATKIQSAYRGYADRKRLSSQKEEKTRVKRDEDVAAAKIQASYRAHLYRKHRREKQEKEISQGAAALKIQAAYRGYTSRKNLAKSKKNSAAARIQAAYRSYRFRQRDKPNQKHAGSEVEAAEKIQAAYKGYRTRKELAVRRKTSIEINAAAIKIQAGYRGYRSRKKLRQSAASTDKAGKAAEKIQAGYKGYRSRKELKRKENSVVKIQAAYRGYQTRKKLRAENEAATKIQSGYRGYGSRRDKLTEHKPHNNKETRVEQEAAALKIQSSYRGYVVRKNQTRRQKLSAFKKDEEDNQQKHQAAVKIQSHYRGYRTRKNL